MLTSVRIVGLNLISFLFALKSAETKEALNYESPPFYKTSDYNFKQHETLKIDLQSSNCKTSTYDENFLYIGCKNRVAIVDVAKSRTTIPVSYSPACGQLASSCGDNQILALSPRKKNVLVCFSEPQEKTFVCTRFRKASDEPDSTIDPIDESFEFRAQFIRPDTVSPMLFDDRKNLFLTGYLIPDFPDIMKLNLDDNRASTAALRIDRGYHNKPWQILSGKPEFIATIQIGDFIYVFLNEVYEENGNRVGRDDLSNKTRYPDDGQQRARIIRICANDQPSLMNVKLWSYFIKASLSCLKNDTFFTKLTAINYDSETNFLFATFTAQDAYISGSAICSYKIDKINEHFGKPVYKWNGLELIKSDNLFPDFKCSSKDKETSSELHDRFKVTIQEPILPDASYRVPGFRIVKIASKTYKNFLKTTTSTVTFGITQNGYLVRHHFKNHEDICQLRPMKFKYESLDQKVTQVHLVPKEGTDFGQIAVVYEEEVVMVPFDGCGKMESARSCVALQDPFCEWNDVTNKCQSSDPSVVGKNAVECPYNIIPADYSTWSPEYTCASGCTCTHRNCIADPSMLLNTTVCADGPLILNVTKCPVDGGWGDWGPWSSCTKGQRTKERKCDRPKPQFNGQDCIGAKIIYESCQIETERTKSPMIPTAVSHWSPWMVTKVDTARNRWSETRLRVQYTSDTSLDASDNFKFQTSGRNCSLIVADTCPQSSVMVDLLNTWTEWSPCSSACGEGRRIRKRKKCMGMVCSGEETETETCNEKSCPHQGGDGGGGAADLLCWSEWTACSSECGSGIRTRQRICPTNNYYNCMDGKQTDNQECDGTSCQFSPPLNHNLRLIDTCRHKLVEEYKCVGPKCESDHVFKPCGDQTYPLDSSEVEGMTLKNDDNDGAVDMKIYILSVTVTAILVAMMFCIFMVIARKCQRHDRTSDHQPKIYDQLPPVDPIVDLGVPVGGRLSHQMANDTLGICSDSFNMSSSHMLPHIWNRDQTMNTFNDNDQPINNGFFSVDYRYSKQRKHEMQEYQRGGYLYGTLNTRRTNQPPMWQ